MTQRKMALVTGGAHPIGIGFASAAKLAENGWDVIVTGLSEAEIALTPKHDHIRPVILDVRDTEAVEALISSLPALDALINAAGMSSPSEFEIADFNRTLDVNVSGTMRTCVASRPLLARSHGAIVNIASIYATFGSAVVPGYSASKGAIVQLTKSLAAAWGADGIRVNAISPGWIRTALASPVFENEEHVAYLTSRTPLGRLGVASDCGDVIAFLCSQEARYVTGVTIPVDGGYIITG
ncbi:SDR family oxidoreductase [Novosphingobium sp. PASSN1]|uniref:SDR family NAD(P)-dependent oxidoreductase n=1 Tax=Novosphingobium sp. PASSN1 TaxID=2015561 RepID=UPI000BD9A8A8|nr:SDR family oxidoreductase [Novosphingobium sp. PASSN1]OYU34771.1 MAG: 2-deoxy-D-gluconate 3-dehydrogenase [Novosphingobium sp. PASSN1]